MFKAWPKIPRIENKKEFYTEKIDGTNACIVILENLDEGWQDVATYIDGSADCWMICQSRSRIITPEDDNFGFAKWAYENKKELSKLGEGYHYGEWWGLGIQRGYDQTEKKFSLFNTKRWGDHNPNTPSCVSVVPTIHANSIEEAKEKLITNGSYAAPGYMKVEGIVIFDYLTQSYYKAIIDK